MTYRTPYPTPAMTTATMAFQSPPNPRPERIRELLAVAAQIQKEANDGAQFEETGGT